MKKDDLLLFLQDIVEQDGDFTYLNTHYVVERNIKLNIVQNIVIHGLENNVFEINKHIKSNKNSDPKNSYLKIDKKEAITIVNDDKSWKIWPEGYEVDFIDIPKYIGILFNAEEQKVPEEFLEFISE